MQAKSFTVGGVIGAVVAESSCRGEPGRMRALPCLRSMGRRPVRRTLIHLGLDRKAAVTGSLPILQDLKSFVAD